MTEHCDVLLAVFDDTSTISGHLRRMSINECQKHPLKGNGKIYMHTLPWTHHSKPRMQRSPWRGTCDSLTAWTCLGQGFYILVQWRPPEITSGYGLHPGHASMLTMEILQTSGMTLHRHNDKGTPYRMRSNFRRMKLLQMDDFQYFRGSPFNSSFI
jgi:hypothetical protein